MTVILLHDDVRAVATQAMAIDAMESVFRLEGEGRVGRPQRVDVPTGNGWLRIMPVVAEGLGLFGFKAMNLVPKVGVRYGVHIYDLAAGALLGIIDAQVLTTLRTAATAAVAARRLAKEQIERAAMIGTGTEARTLLEAMQLVRPTASVTVYSRNPVNRSRFIADMREVVDVDFLECDNVDDAVSRAQLVMLATKSSSPVLLERHVEPGMHVSSIGSARLDQFELEPAAFARFDAIACDSVEHVATEAGDAAAAVENGWWDPQSSSDLSRLIVDGAGGRADGDSTLFKSVGTATQDLALGAAVLSAARSKGLGFELDGFPYMKPLI